jgi:hypothetical protein
VSLPVPPLTLTVTVKACAVVMLDADGVTVTAGVAGVIVMETVAVAVV